MTRTCGQCSAFCPDVEMCEEFNNGVRRNEKACDWVPNGWDIEWKASSVVWVMDSDGDWELYTEGYKFYLGLVGANSTHTQWMAFFNLHEVGTFDDVRDAAKALIARVKGETDG